jgi:hypothetical protein
MKILFDECLPRRLKNCLPGHDCRAVPEMGWAGKSNGDLLALAEPSFSVLITMDANLDYQQNLRGRRQRRQDRNHAHGVGPIATPHSPPPGPRRPGGGVLGRFSFGTAGG